MSASERYGYQSQAGPGLQKPDAAKKKHVRGVLHTPVGAEHGRIPTTHAQVAEYVEHFWWARWHLDEPRFTEVLTYPSVHVVFERDHERIVGVVRAKFVRKLEGQGDVFGVKFRPGMFRPFCVGPVQHLTDRERPLGDELGAGFARGVRSNRTITERARVAERLLVGVLPAPPARALLARDLVERVRADRELRNVADLARVAGLTERALQRLFRDFVGVSPKWVTTRFRLQEAAELLATTHKTLAHVAAQLGYFDQAHFARDFKTVVGLAPSEFVAERRAHGADTTRGAPTICDASRP